MIRVLRAPLLLVVLAASAACTTLGVAPAPGPAPSPAPTPAPPVSAPLPAPVPAPPPAAATPSRPSPAPTRSVVAPRPQSDASSASGVLLEQSRTQRAAGSLPAARASLDRALRLDPNNPEVWIEIGELELQAGNTAQAATMARKAITLTGRDTRLAARAERLLRAAE